MPRTAHELYGLYSEFGVLPGLAPDEARTLAKLLVQEPAHSDPKHINHDIVVADANQLYTMAYPEEQQ